MKKSVEKQYWQHDILFNQIRDFGSKHPRRDYLDNNLTDNKCKMPHITCAGPLNFSNKERRGKTKQIEKRTNEWGY